MSCVQTFLTAGAPVGRVSGDATNVSAASQPFLPERRRVGGVWSTALANMAALPLYCVRACVFVCALPGSCPARNLCAQIVPPPGLVSTQALRVSLCKANTTAGELIGGNVGRGWHRNALISFRFGFPFSFVESSKLEIVFRLQVFAVRKHQLSVSRSRVANTLMILCLSNMVQQSIKTAEII